MHVVIAGGGVGGLVLALSLAARGIRPSLIEREPNWGEAGAGVQLGPNAVRLLDDLGLGKALRAQAHSPDAAEVLSSGGALRLRVPLGPAALARWGAPYLQVHRADLQRVLLDAVIARGAAELRTGVAVESAEADGSVRLVDGARLASDVLVGADGLWSRVRDAVAGPGSPRFAGQVAWRALIPIEGLAPEAAPTNATVWTGHGRHVVAYPVRAGRAINLVAVVAGAAASPGWRAPGDPAVLAAMFENWSAPVRALTQAPGTLALDVGRWSVYDRPPPHVWTLGRIALLGDAAHPMAPFLAQGAAMAIEDAVTLAAALTERQGVATALCDYAAERASRVARVHAASRRNARLFHLPEPFAAVAFGAARRLDAGDPAGAMARFDWLYGWRPRDWSATSRRPAGRTTRVEPPYPPG